VAPQRSCASRGNRGTALEGKGARVWLASSVSYITAVRLWTHGDGNNSLEKEKAGRVSCGHRKEVVSKMYSKTFPSGGW